MASQTDSPLRTFYRLAIMLGTLTCVSMAWYRYGPPPGEVADLIDQAAAHVMELDASSVPDEQPLAATAAEPAPAFQASNLPPGVAPSEPPRFDPAVSQATALEPVRRREVTPVSAVSIEALERERLTAPLLAAGASRADVVRWGRSEPPVYRATAAAAVGDSSTGLERRLDAIGSTPDEAVERLLDELRLARAR